MTAEIAIMNKEAIALAADSAVTMGQEKGQKVFASANKLFTLSKYYPVGIMIYGQAIFMGIPWESVIKMYRNQSGKQKFNTLKEYADKFIAFLDKENPLFPEDQQKKLLFKNTVSYFNLIKEDIKKAIESIMCKENKVTAKQISEITSDTIKKHFNKLEKLKVLPGVPKEHIEDIIEKYKDVIDQAREKVFEKLVIPRDLLEKLRKISASLFSKEIFPNNISGIAIAGFGEKDTFPSLRSFKIEGIVNNKLKYKEEIYGEINFENAATIIPFAQREMVDTFMEGMDPLLKQFSFSYLEKIFTKFPETLLEQLSVNAKQKEVILGNLKKASKALFEDYKTRLKDYTLRAHISPIVNIVAMLPKDELAIMAETLVNLTSFKRRITMDAETVGGPVDVAVISKGDGFVWIKRKHYFKAELNPQFFSNYYRR